MTVAHGFRGIGRYCGWERSVGGRMTVAQGFAVLGVSWGVIRPWLVILHLCVFQAPCRAFMKGTVWLLSNEVSMKQAREQALFIEGIASLLEVMMR